MSLAPTHPVDVLLILRRHGEELLLALRDGTGYADGMWNLPSGKLETCESAVSALVREAREEVGVRLNEAEVKLVATIHHRNVLGLGRIGLVFSVEHNPERHGEVINMEPHKCSRIGWFHMDGLPVNTYLYTAAAISAYRKGDTLRLSGWA